MPHCWAIFVHVASVTIRAGSLQLRKKLCSTCFTGWLMKKSGTLLGCVTDEMSENIIISCL
jgi:hypothetical protein